MWRTARRLLRDGQFDLLHSHGLTAACHCELARLGMHVPHVATVHEPLRPGQFPGLVGRLKHYAVGRLLHRTDVIVTVSNDARANLLESVPALAARPERVVTIPNGVHASRFASAARPGFDLRHALGLGAEVPLVGFLGRFMPEKGFSLLLDAAEQLAREQDAAAFHVVAFGSGDYRREYQGRIAAAGLTRRVTLRDFVHDVTPVLRQFDLVIVPSLWEASSLVSMEALCAGVPVLGSDCPGLREVLCGTPSRTFRNGDADALRHALWVAIDNLWTEAARAFAPEARRRFDARAAAGRLVEVYGRLTAPQATEVQGARPRKVA